MSYKNLEIWQLAREVAVEIHKMSLEKLPKFELLGKKLNNFLKNFER